MLFSCYPKFIAKLRYTSYPINSLTQQLHRQETEDMLQELFFKLIRACDQIQIQVPTRQESDFSGQLLLVDPL